MGTSFLYYCGDCSNGIKVETGIFQYAVTVEKTILQEIQSRTFSLDDEPCIR